MKPLAMLIILAVILFGECRGQEKSKVDTVYAVKVQTLDAQIANTEKYIEWLKSEFPMANAQLAKLKELKTQADTLITVLKRKP